jgi:hypothetical protein
MKPANPSAAIRQKADGATNARVPGSLDLSTSKVVAIPLPSASFGKRTAQR